MTARRKRRRPRTVPAMTNPHPLIGFTGYLNSGKDAAAEPLVHDGYHHGSFARKLKDFLYAVNPQVVQNTLTYRVANLVDAYGWERAKDDFPEIRALLQRTGTDAGRKILGSNVWIDAALADVPDGPVVFTDVRFPDEADALRARGGLVIRVNRPGFEPGPDAHESETAMDGYRVDWSIDNDRTLGELHGEVRAVVHYLTTGDWPQVATQA